MSTVTISLKTPSGLSYTHKGKEYTINGWNAESALFINPVEKAGITTEFPSDVWDAFKAEFKDHDLFKNGLIFADKSENTVKSETKERKGTKSGLEAIDPNAKKDGVSSYRIDE